MGSPKGRTTDLRQTLFGAVFQNPLLLASGTCGFGEEVAGVLDLERLGGFVTKAVTVAPREGNAAPRVCEFDAGMLNSIGLANPGVNAVCRQKLPWIRAHVRHARVFVNVAGQRTEDYVRVIEVLDGEEGFLGYELNVSCPNDRHLRRLPFGLDADALAQVVASARAATRRPLLVKLAPNVPDIAEMARITEDAGADGVTLINTFPGLIIDPTTQRPALGAETGGVSGPAIRPMGVHAVWCARARISIPIVGVGGITSGEDAVQYLLAGASLVQIGTATFADPRAALRVVAGLQRYGRALGLQSIGELVGAAARERGSAPPAAVPALSD
ncbi:MAG: dihydroorotate dehydrogenase [Gemmatimonadetes bacterium]|nr:dihydroorotate dehydrogenase [Gemmatimonadota bacterium]